MRHTDSHEKGDHGHGSVKPDCFSKAIRTPSFEREVERVEREIDFLKAGGERQHQDEGV